MKRRLSSILVLVLLGCGEGDGDDRGSSRIDPWEGSGGGVPTLALLAGALGGRGNTDGTGLDVRLSRPAGVATDGTHVFVADTSNHAIRKIVLATGEVTTLAGTAGSLGSADGTGSDARFYLPHGVATDGTHLFVADTYNHTIRKIVISTGSVTTLVGVPGQACVRLGALPAVINRPGGVAIVPGGRLAISSEGENSILLMSGTPEGQSGPSAGRAP